MTSEALKNLLKRHGKEIAEEAEAEEEQAANEGTSGHKGTSDRAEKNNKRE